MDFIYKSHAFHANGVSFSGIFFYLNKVQSTLLTNMINRIFCNQIFRFSAHLSVKTSMFGMKKLLYKAPILALAGLVFCLLDRKL